MLSKFLSFALNHKKKLIFVGFLFGGYKLVQSPYVQKCVLQWCQRRYMEKYEKEELFKFINQICGETVKKFQVNVFQRISEIFATEELLDEYKRAESKSEKLEIWKRLRLLTFSQITAILYANVLFILGITVHFSVTVAYQFVDENKQPEIGSSHLSCIVNFIENNLKRICDFIQTTITPVVDGTRISDSFSFPNLELMFYTIQSAMCIDPNNPLRHMGQYFYDNATSTSLNDTDEKFNAVTKDAKFFLNTEEAVSLATSLVSKSFHVLMTEITADDEFAEMTTGLPLVKIIPKLCNRLTSKHYEQVFLNCIPSDKTVDTLSANVFEAFCR